MSYTYKIVTKERFKDLKHLYQKVFGNNYMLAYVEKKYSPFSSDNLLFGHIAYFNDEPVAFHGAIPVKMKYNDDIEIAAQYGDAMTLPNHTGKGLFTKLGKLTDEQLKNSGIKFVWGFPNQNSEYGYIHKLNWQFKERIIGYQCNNDFFSLEKAFQLTSKTSDLYKKHIEKTLSKLKVKRELVGSVFKTNDIVSTCRDKEFYDYKSINDNFIIEIEKVKFWIKIKNGLLIGDIETSSEENFYIALNKLKSIVFSKGISKIVIQASPNTQIDFLMKKTNWTSFQSWIVGYKNFSSQFPLEKLKFTFGDLDTF